MAHRINLSVLRIIMLANTTKINILSLYPYIYEIFHPSISRHKRTGMVRPYAQKGENCP